MAFEEQRQRRLKVAIDLYPKTSKETPMNAQDVREQMKNVVVTNVTPFTDIGEVDWPEIERQSTFMTDAGIRVLVPCGNTGEFTSLTSEEAKGVVTVTCGAAPDGTVVAAGVGGSSRSAVDLAMHAQEAGAHAVMVHHPTHTYIDRQGLRAYYERILDAVDIGVVLYKRGPEVSDTLIADLVQHDRVVAVKYATNDVNAFANLVDHAGRDAVAWLCGTAERWAPFFWLAGAHGFTSGLANFAPSPPLAMFEAMRQGDVAEVMRIRRQLTAFEELRQENHSAKNVPAVKEAMAILGFGSATVRDPLARLEQEDRQAVAAMLDEWGLIRVAAPTR